MKKLSLILSLIFLVSLSSLGYTGVNFGMTGAVKEKVEELDKKVKTAKELPEIDKAGISVAEVRGLPRGTSCRIRTVIEGNQRVDLQAKFLEVMDDFGLGFPLLVCETSDPHFEQYSGIVAGMSGSPVLIGDKVAGALAYGAAFTTNPPYIFLVTPLEYMKEVAQKKPMEDYLKMSSAEMSPARLPGLMPIKIPFSVPLSWGEKAFGKDQLGQNPNLELFSGSGNNRKAPSSSSGPLMPGDMIAVTLASGPLLNLEAYGTVTWIEGNEIYAFGHSFLNSGKFQAPFRRAWVHKVISSNYVPFKFCSSEGDFLGTINRDFTPGISGELGDTPPMVPIILKYMGPDGQKREMTHYVAYGQEWLIADILGYNAFTWRDEWSPGSMEGTISLKFNETEKSIKLPLQASSSDPLWDVCSQIYGLLETFMSRAANNVERVTLKEVELEIYDSAEIKTAEIMSVEPKGDLIAGDTCEIEVKIKPYRGLPVSETVSLEIPADFPGGKANLSAIAGEFGDIGIEEIIGDGEEIGDEQDTEFPQTLEELISQVEEDWAMAGKITITLTSTSFFNGEEMGEGKNGEVDIPEVKPEEPVKKELLVEWVIEGYKEEEVEVKKSPTEP
ncbi:MAG: SpoIVB peptidase S55 domain-containing protein [bacterium]|nr:SpoIVB peptidase S55 domain-containing protein [bacterium]